MSKPKCPMDALVDAACGVKPGEVPTHPGWITLECPNCHSQKQAARHPIDPATAIRILFPCPKCRACAKPEPEYYDNEGKLLPF